MREDLPIAGTIGRAARIDRNHKCLAAESVGHAADQHRIVNGRRVDSRLVGTCKQKGAHVFHAAHATSHGQRQEHLLGGHANHVEHRCAAVGRRGDIEETDFVGALPIVFGCDFDGIAGVAKLDEANALFHAAGVHVETRNDSACEHGLLLLGSRGQRFFDGEGAFV